MRAGIGQPLRRRPDLGRGGGRDPVGLRVDVGHRHDRHPGRVRDLTQRRAASSLSHPDTLVVYRYTIRIVYRYTCEKVTAEGAHGATVGDALTPRIAHSETSEDALTPPIAHSQTSEDALTPPIAHSETSGDALTPRVPHDAEVGDERRPGD